MRSEASRQRHRIYMRELRRLKREGRHKEEMERRKVAREQKAAAKGEQIESAFLKRHEERELRRQNAAQLREQLKREIAEIRWQA